MTAAQIEDAAKHRAAITAHLNALLGGDAAVLVPATPFAAPKLGMPVEQLDDCWMPIITLVAPAAMAGLPQARPRRGFLSGACMRDGCWMPISALVGARRHGGLPQARPRRTLSGACMGDALLDAHHCAGHSRRHGWPAAGALREGPQRALYWGGGGVR